MPKPIYQTHRVWTAALSCKPGPPAFTTTPLYHGGASDFLRAIMSQSTLYLFTSERPITAQNVVSSIKACPDVRYFLAVPYILKMLAEDLQARDLLAQMDMISVGGAPLPQELGDQMVKDYKWKLVSRMGSSECGCASISCPVFTEPVPVLMSSYRAFEQDIDWSFLRNPVENGMLHFKIRQEGIAELTVDKAWPTLVRKTFLTLTCSPRRRMSNLKQKKALQQATCTSNISPKKMPGDTLVAQTMCWSC